MKRHVQKNHIEIYELKLGPFFLISLTNQPLLDLFLQEVQKIAIIQVHSFMLFLDIHSKNYENSPNGTSTNCETEISASRPRLRLKDFGLRLRVRDQY